jgi:hypothetical protein
MRREPPSLDEAAELERDAQSCRLPEVAQTLRRMAASLRPPPRRRARRRIDPRDTPDPFLR